MDFSQVALPFQECRPKFLLFWLVVNAVGVLASAAYFIYLVVIYSTAGAEGAAGKNFLINLLRVGISVWNSFIRVVILEIVSYLTSGVTKSDTE